MQTKYYVDSNGKYLGGFAGVEPPSGALEIESPPDHGDKRLVDGQWINITTLSSELSERSTQFKNDMQVLQLRWLAVAVADGAAELSKKTVVEQDIADLKAQYTIDIASIKAKYN